MDVVILGLRIFLLSELYSNKNNINNIINVYSGSDKIEKKGIWKNKQIYCGNTATDGRVVYRNATQWLIMTSLLH